MSVNGLILVWQGLQYTFSCHKGVWKFFSYVKVGMVRSVSASEGFPVAGYIKDWEWAN